MIARTGWLTLLVVLGLHLPTRADDSKKPRYPKSPSADNVKLVPDAWKTVPVKALAPADLDRLLMASQKGDKVKPAAPAADDVFFRRVIWISSAGCPPPATPRHSWPIPPRRSGAS